MSIGSIERCRMLGEEELEKTLMPRVVVTLDHWKVLRNVMRVRFIHVLCESVRRRYMCQNAEISSISRFFSRNSHPRLFGLCIMQCNVGVNVEFKVTLHEQVRYRVALTDPSWKCLPGRPRTKWTDQLRRDNSNVPIATLYTEAS